MDNRYDCLSFGQYQAIKMLVPWEQQLPSNNNHKATTRPLPLSADRKGFFTTDIAPERMPNHL